MTLLDRVVALLDSGGISHAIIGGVALAAAGVARSTLDVDLLTTAGDVLDQRFWEPLAGSAVVIDVRKGDGADPLAGLVRFESVGERPVDLVVGKLAWQARAVARATRPSEGPAVVLPRDLVLLKLYAGGAQDLWDINELLHTVDAASLIAQVEADLDDLPPWMRERWTSIRT